MIKNPLVIVKHLFQISMTKQFGIPISVYVSQRNAEPEIIMVQQTTLDNWGINTTTTPISTKPIWVGAKVSIPPNIIDDVQTLTDTFEEIN